MKRSCQIVVLTCLTFHALAISALCDSSVRQWTSQRGTRVDASLVRQDGRWVVLRKQDGALIKIEAQYLSPDDQRFLQSLQAVKKQEMFLRKPARKPQGGAEIQQERRPLRHQVIQEPHLDEQLGDEPWNRGMGAGQAQDQLDLHLPQNPRGRQPRFGDVADDPDIQWPHDRIAEEHMPRHQRQKKPFPRNDNPLAVWNNPINKDNPLAPHNSPIDKDNPLKPWNSPIGSDDDLTTDEKKSYGLDTSRDEYPKNKSPFAAWNSPMHKDSPFAPHNNPIDRESPFKPWNSPMGNNDDLNHEEKKAYGIEEW